MMGIWYFGLVDVDDDRVVCTMKAVEETLTVRTAIGGEARREHDYYQAVNANDQNVPGNPWPITTLWRAQWYIKRAKTLADLKPARERLEWLLKVTTSAGLLAEQVDPYTGAPLSVCPLGWSHGTAIMAIDEYVAKFGALKKAATTA